MRQDWCLDCVKGRHVADAPCGRCWHDRRFHLPQTDKARLMYPHAAYPHMEHLNCTVLDCVCEKFQSRVRAETEDTPPPSLYATRAPDEKIWPSYYGLTWEEVENK